MLLMSQVFWDATLTGKFTNILEDKSLQLVVRHCRYRLLDPDLDLEEEEVEKEEWRGKGKYHKKKAKKVDEEVEGKKRQGEEEQGKEANA
jgi:hypothetical protein